jgi:sec-independent protein translocase protein TatB
VFNLQGSEIIVILLLALVVLGPEKLPDAVRRFMQTYHELRKMGEGFQSELKSALDEPMKELRDTANLIKDNADPNRLLAESNAENRLEHPESTAVPGSAGDDVQAASETAAAPLDDAPATLGVVDPGSPTVGVPGSPPVRAAGTVRPIHQPDRLDDGAPTGDSSAADSAPIADSSAGGHADDDDEAASA